MGRKERHFRLTVAVMQGSGGLLRYDPAQMTEMAVSTGATAPLGSPDAVALQIIDLVVTSWHSTLGAT
jgi:hypothetical protein